MKGVSKLQVTTKKAQYKLNHHLWSTKLFFEILAMNGFEVKSVLNFRNFDTLATEADHRILFTAEKVIIKQQSLKL